MYMLKYLIHYKFSILLAAFISLLSLIPANSLPDSSLFSLSFLDKLVHMGMYGSISLVSLLENRCRGKGEWNTYDVVCVDGTIKLSVNGKFVNGISRSSKKSGYLCLESEGAEIHFRNIRIMELP